jgi:anti-sigma-K factor RskA
MIAEHHEELAALYALGLLEGRELADFETALTGNPELQALVRDLAETSALLAETTPAVTPGPALKARILARLDAANPATAGTGNLVPFRFGLWAGWALAACLAVLSLWTGQLYFTVRTQNALLQEQQALASTTLRSAQNQLAAERILNQHQLQDASRQIATLGQKLRNQGDLAQFKISTLVSMLGNSPQAMAVAVWNPATQEGVLRTDKLPPLAPDKDYQLWVVDPQYPNPVDGGVFRVDPKTGEARYQFKADKPIRTVAKFAVSLERRGGVPKAEGPMVLLSE